MTTTREEQRDVVDDPTYSLEVVHGKAGDCVCLNDRRICGPKPWGGGRITSTWSVRRSDILAAIPDLEAENDRLRASQAGGVPAGWRDLIEEIDAELDRQLYDEEYVRQCRNNDLDVPSDCEHHIIIREALRSKIAKAAASPPPPAIDHAGWQDISTAPKDGTYVDIWGVNPAGRRFPGVRWTDWPPVGAVDGFTWRDERGVPVVDHADAVATNWMALPSAPGAPPPATDGGLTIADYERAFEDHKRLVRRLDVLLNGEAGAAPQASLCDIVGQLEGAKRNAVPATDGDALRKALDLCLTGGNHIATVLIGRLGGGFAGPLSPDASHEFARARIADQDTYEIWCCWSALMRAREMAEAKAALASVPTPVSDGDSVLRKAVALVITHHVNQNRQKRRPESDSFTLKTLREALAATPVSATDAVEAEREALDTLRMHANDSIVPGWVAVPAVEWDAAFRVLDAALGADASTEGGVE